MPAPGTAYPPPPPPPPPGDWAQPGYPPPGYGPPMQPGWPGPPPSPRASGQAIAALVLSILWFLGAGSLAAVILAHLDRNSAKQAGQQQSGIGLAAMIVGYLGLVGAAAVIVLVATGVSAAHNAIDNQQKVLDVQANLRNLATAEESYLTQYDTYTNNGAALTTAGFTQFGLVHDELIAGYSGTSGYCLLGSAGAGDPWFLYDSQAGGISQTTFSSSTSAEAACSQAVTNYATIS